MQPLRNRERCTLVPASLIHDQDNVLVWPHPLLFCEGGQRQREGLRIDRRNEQPTGRAALRLHKPIEIHPLITWSDHCPDSASFAGPDAAQDGTQTDAVLILAPQFDPGFGIHVLQLADLLGQFF